MVDELDVLVARASRHSSATSSIVCRRRRVALVEHEQQRPVAGVVAAVGLGRVVEPQHGRGGAALHDPAHGVEAGGEGREAVGGPALVRGRRVEPQAGAGDDAEGALGADEELGEVGPDRGARGARRW